MQDCLFESGWKLPSNRFAELGKTLAAMPGVMKKALVTVPFHQQIIDATPILALWLKTEKMLWYQRLGHPCDEYLYNAHKAINGIPKFAFQNSALDQCPTCI